MKIGKFLKVSRLVKRRTAAKGITDQGRVKVSDRIAKPSYDVKVGDVIEIGSNMKQLRARALDLREATRKAKAGDLYELID